MTKEQTEFYNAQVGSPLQIAIKDNEPLQKQIVEMIDACKKMVVAEERDRMDKEITKQFKYASENDNYDMTPLKKYLEKYDEDIKPMIENEVLYRYDNVKLAQNSADILNKEVRQFLSTTIAQAEQEMIKRIVAKCAERFHPYCGGDKEGDINCFDKLVAVIKE